MQYFYLWNLLSSLSLFWGGCHAFSCHIAHPGRVRSHEKRRGILCSVFNLGINRFLLLLSRCQKSAWESFRWEPQPFRLKNVLLVVFSQTSNLTAEWHEFDCWVLRQSEMKGPWPDTQSGEQQWRECSHPPGQRALVRGTGPLPHRQAAQLNQGNWFHDPIPDRLSVGTVPSGSWWIGTEWESEENKLGKSLRTNKIES